MRDLVGGTALIVGGSSGIGRAVAGLFAARGARLILGARDPLRLEAAAAGLCSGTRRLCFDMRDPEQTAAALAGLPEGGLDWLVITAAEVAHGPFATMPVDTARALFDSKFWGAYALCRAALPHLRDGGAIVLVSGVLSRRPGVNCSALGAACAAIEGLTRGLALELGPRLRVNCVAPGMVRTPLHDRHPPERRAAMFAATGASLPVGRVGSAGEVAQAVVMAATNGYMTGQVLDVDGGHTIRQFATGCAAGQP